MRTLVLTLIVALVSINAYAKGPCTSQNPGLQWTIDTLYVDGTVAAIQGDGAPYVNGQTGVEAVINVCSGTYDATLLVGSGRSLNMSFAHVVATNAYTPSWALAGATESGGGFVNVRDLWFVPPNATRLQEYTFTTWVNINVPVSGSPLFAMLNSVHDTPISGPNEAHANYPDTNAQVVVHHCPANSNTPNCPNVTAETWFVYPALGTSGEVGALFTTVKGQPGVNSGEFSMPFLFTLSLLN
jgi:hypothetical protein